MQEGARKREREKARTNIRPVIRVITTLARRVGRASSTLAFPYAYCFA